MTTAPNTPNPAARPAKTGPLRPPPAEPRVGDVVGAYLLVDELAAGGMGRVFRAVDREGGAFALKTILKNEGIYRKRFEREVQVGMVLDHPHLVKLVDCDMNHPWPYLVQELLMGVNLRDLYKARRRLPEPAVMVIVLQIARALNAAMRFGIVHRDIKPDNIFMTTTGACKLLDMGLVKVAGMERVTEPIDLIGTLQFMAPEQLRDASAVDHLADIYSLGATAFLLLTGRLPRRGKNLRDIIRAMLATPQVSPRRIFEGVSKATDAIVARMTMIDPAERYETPARLVEDVERYFRDQGLEPRTLPSEFLLQQLIPDTAEPAPAGTDADIDTDTQAGDMPGMAVASDDYVPLPSADRLHRTNAGVSGIFQLPAPPPPRPGPG